MCKFCGTKNYRKIYESHHGKIPLDSFNRTYEIHHIDGNHSNNDPSNLIAVTIEKHYNIHYSQGDWAACMRMSERMKISPQEKSELASLHNKKMIQENRHPLMKRSDGSSHATDKVKDGTHPWLGEKNPVHRMNKDGTNALIGGEIQRTVGLKRWKELGQLHPAAIDTRRRVIDGTHNLLGDKNPVHELVKNGTHHLLGGQVQRESLKNGTHPSLTKWECHYCGKKGQGSGPFNRWHGNNCKMKKEDATI